MARIWEMDSVDTQSQQLMDAIGEQRRMRRREGSGSWRTFADLKLAQLQQGVGVDASASAAAAYDPDGCDDDLSEPPLSLNAAGERNYHLVGAYFDIPLHHHHHHHGGSGRVVTSSSSSSSLLPQHQHGYQQHAAGQTEEQQQQSHRPRAATVVPMSNQSTPINLSPLTASSVCAMEKEYDRDTWRMYQRIKSARSVPTLMVPPKVHDRSNSMSQLDFMPNNNNNNGVTAAAAGATLSGNNEFGGYATELSARRRHDFESSGGYYYPPVVPVMMGGSLSSSLNLVSYNEDYDGGHDEIFEMDLDS